MLLTGINTIFMPGEPILPKMVSSIRDFSLIACTILSFIMLFVQLEIVLSGIYDFFRKVKANYILGVIAAPWLYYYLVILIPTILIILDLSLQIWKVKEK